MAKFVLVFIMDIANVSMQFKVCAFMSQKFPYVVVCVHMFTDSESCGWDKGSPWTATIHAGLCCSFI
ncbi:hypothetical protein KP509_35G062100 [Ceratopteris richardii]|uniref:Secreted protein n=1 Tax=Ceratopteris richardii TaxID=49495 RepID=A0A8T2QIA0_CERRI|nr:hypothetical protein KP509_35G062000 [Ceratopteris richardii]KAH7283123.1 hypothetical protein KP509_35G062100 [Ceratopteris richardii]